ncbi:MAG: hypothetical protein HYZ45_06780 [Burkholderiales bacterium]|nr:hypothetical protein [Burkholderiales bacterium]
MFKFQKTALFVGWVAIACSSTAAQQGWKPKLLSRADEARWIQTIKMHKASDGATVAEVLSYVEHMRPRQFKVSEISIGYNGATGEPDTVSISYWIGRKRSADDAFVDLGYNMTRDGKIKAVSEEATTLKALEQGRESFLREIDSICKMTCHSEPNEKPRC